MNSVFKFAAVAALLSACSAPTPEERAARNAEDLRIMTEVAQGMAVPAPAAAKECLNQVATGSYSEANLLKAGFNKGNTLVNSGYSIDVSSPVKLGPLVTRPLALGINVGPTAAINFQSGCKVSLPTQGNAAMLFGASASSVAQSQGYSVTAGGAGSFTFAKGDMKIKLQITRTISNGTSWLDARMSKAN